MDTALPQKIPFILDRNLANANSTENQVCTSCDTVVLGYNVKYRACQVWQSVRVWRQHWPLVRRWLW